MITLTIGLVRNMTRTVLFDLDGVIVNTEELKSQTHDEVVQTLGSTLPTNFYSRVIGQSDDAVATQAIRLAHLPTSVDEYKRRFTQRYETHLREWLQIAPGSLDLVRALKARNYKLGVVSSNSKAVVKYILSDVELLTSFDVVVTASDITLPKPSPEAYLHALALLKSDPRKVVAFEDTEPGIVAAHDAGLIVVAVRHSLSENQDFTMASAIVDGFSSYTSVVDLIERLMKR
jgi:HAD superfamily hydrolase (TIGR01509 family)